MSCGCTKPAKVVIIPPTVFNVEGAEESIKVKIGVQAKIQIVGMSRTINITAGQAIRIGQNWLDQLLAVDAPIWVIG